MAEALKKRRRYCDVSFMVLEENDPAELAHALGVIAKAKGITQIYWSRSAL